MADGHSGRALAQIDENTASRLPEDVIDGRKHGLAAEHVLDHVLAMKPDGNLVPAGLAEDECQMLNGVEGRRIGDGFRVADRRLDGESPLALDQALARLPVGDEARDGDDLELLSAGEIDDLLPALDGSV